MVLNISEIRYLAHVICLVGPGGCGKRKKGMILEHALMGSRFEMSELITKHRDHHELSKLGAQLEGTEAVQRSGNLVMDEPVITLFEMAVASAYSIGGPIMISDGFPRTVPQAKKLHGYKLPFTLFYIHIDKPTSIARIKQRALEEGERIDDDAAEDRYSVFIDETLPAIKLLQQINPQAVKKIDGTLPVREQMVKMFRVICKRNHTERYLKLESLVACLDTPGNAARTILMDMMNPKKKAAQMPLHRTHPAIHNLVTTSAQAFA